MTQRSMGTFIVLMVMAILATTALAQPPSPAGGPSTPSFDAASPGSSSAFADPDRLPPGNMRPGIYAARDWRYLAPEDYPIVGGHEQFTWQQIEQSSNTFTWSKVDEFLAGQNMQGKAAGIGFVTYLGRIDGGIKLPEWLIADHSETVINCSGRLIPRYWNTTYQNFYRRFVQAAATRYGSDGRLHWVQVGVGLYGENQPADDADDGCIAQALFADFGIDPGAGGASARSAKWTETVNQITDLYAAAFRDKPLFNQYAPSYVRRCERKDITDHAGGIVTATVGLFAAGLLPDQLDVVNPAGQAGCGKFDPIFTWNQIPTRTVPTAFETYGYMLPDATSVYWGMLSALNKHVDVLNLNSDLLVRNGDKNQPATENFPIFRFANRFLGKTLANTPEVWVALREHDRAHSENDDFGAQYGNYSFWLYQDDNAPGGRTVTATTTITSTRFAAELTGMEGWTTRRTNEATDNPYMYFNVDDGYPATSGVITVTYFNHLADSWYLEYMAGDGSLQQLTVQKTNSNTWLKAVFLIASIRLTNSIEGNDFRIFSMGDGDEFIHMVEFSRSGAVPPTVTATATGVAPATPTRTTTPTATATGGGPPSTPTRTSTATRTPSGTPTAVVVPVSCGDVLRTYSGNTQTDGVGLIGTYNCGGEWHGNEFGPEVLYQITTAGTRNLFARLRPDYTPASPGDPDVFILSAPGGAACLPGGYGDMGAIYSNAPAGTYYIAVDGWQGWQGSYTVEIACSVGPVIIPTRLPNALFLPVIIR